MRAVHQNTTRDEHVEEIGDKIALDTMLELWIAWGRPDTDRFSNLGHI